MQADSTEMELLGLLNHAERVRGKTKFQKLVYFLQEGEGVPTGLNFRMHHYGPYSPALETCLQRLEMRNLVEVDYASIDGPVLIDVTETGRGMGEQSRHTKMVEEVLQKLGSKSPRQLELLGTAHYLGGATAYDGSPDARDRLIKAVKAWKQARFTYREIDSAIDELVQLGYLS